MQVTIVSSKIYHCDTTGTNKSEFIPDCHTKETPSPPYYTLCILKLLFSAITFPQHILDLDRYLILMASFEEFGNSQAPTQPTETRNTILHTSDIYAMRSAPL